MSSSTDLVKDEGYLEAASSTINQGLLGVELVWSSSSPKLRRSGTPNILFNASSGWEFIGSSPRVCWNSLAVTLFSSIHRRTNCLLIN